MKTFNGFITITSCIVFLLLTMSCEQKINVGSVLHPDGAIDRVVNFTEVDSTKASKNIFGLSEANGWEAIVELRDNEDSKSDTVKQERKFNISFKKHFLSSEEANKDLNNNNDSLFHVRSSFEKRFRWFYTYIDYSDTYAAINRFQSVPVKDFFTPEDFSFINRLPAEEETMTKADALFLKHLQTKVYENYLGQAVFDENYDMIAEAVKHDNIGDHWIDTLEQHKGYLLSTLLKSEDEDMIESPFMIGMLDTLLSNFPVEKIESTYRARHATTQPRIRFMLEVASQAKFTHSIEMPWEIIASNADSINGSSLYWNPPMLKFTLTDYTMHATARKMNYWAVVLSAVIVMVTIFLFVRKRRVA
jgi:hypothetical protein